MHQEDIYLLWFLEKKYSLMDVISVVNELGYPESYLTTKNRNSSSFVL